MLPVHIIKIPTFKSPAAQTQYFFGWLGNCQNFRPKNSMPDFDVFKWRSSWTGLIVCNHTIFQWLISIWSWDANNKYCQLRRKAKRGLLPEKKGKKKEMASAKTFASVTNFFFLGVVLFRSQGFTRQSSQPSLAVRHAKSSRYISNSLQRYVLA